MISVLVCRGVGEALPSPMLSNVTKLIDTKRFVIKEVPWEANYSPVPNPIGSSFHRALRDGRTLLLKMIADDPNPVILLSYSGGAALAGNVAAEIARGEHPGLDIRGVALISDPLRPMSRGTITGWERAYGIAGSREIGPAFPRWWIADQQDVITYCPDRSPLRTIAAQSVAFSLVDPIAWGWDLIDKLRHPWKWPGSAIDWSDPLGTIARFKAARIGAEGYLLRGSHTNYHTRIYRDGRTYCEWLADRINEIRETAA